MDEVRPLINKEKGRLYAPNYCYEVQKLGRQTTTGSDVEFQATDSITITEPTKTELTVLLYAAANEATHASKTYTLVYKSNDGVQHTASATGTATLNDTAVAFTDTTSGDAVTDFYCAVSFTVSAAFANTDVSVATSTPVIYATITATATAATEAQLGGLGNIYGRSPC